MVDEHAVDVNKVELLTVDLYTAIKEYPSL